MGIGNGRSVKRGGKNMAGEEITTVDLELESDESSAASILDTAREHLAFVSDGLHFVVDASHVKEIITNHSITQLPKLPPFIKGVINLRGQIIPIIDMRLRMGRPEIEYGDEACVIVIDVNSVQVGLLVERVSHVAKIREEDISPPPVKNKQELVSGITKVDEVVYLVLDCELIVKQDQV